MLPEEIIDDITRRCIARDMADLIVPFAEGLERAEGMRQRRTQRWLDYRHHTLGILIAIEGMPLDEFMKLGRELGCVN